MKKIFLNSIIVLLLVNTFIGCAQKNAEAFKDENEKRDLKEVCRDVKYGISNNKKIAEKNAEKFGNLSSEKSVSNYENKLNSCIKSHNILDFDATSAEQWNREDIKDQLKNCHLRIKNGETEFELKNYQGLTQNF